MNYRTDLALERREMLGETIPEGVNFSEQFYGKTKVTRIEIQNEKGKAALGKPLGKYITVELNDWRFDDQNSKKEIEIIAREIKPLIGDVKAVLIAGLGNRDITPDIIGPLVCDMSLATRHINSIDKNLGFRDVSVISPGVMGKTGIESSEIIKSIAEQSKANCVIVVDALASKSSKRLGKTVQICNTGICPGSGVGNARAEISQKTLGIPVVAIGVPTVTDAYTIAMDCGVEPVGENMMVTPREIDAIVKGVSRILALAIGRALHPDIDTRQLYYLSV